MEPVLVDDGATDTVHSPGNIENKDTENDSKNSWLFFHPFAEISHSNDILSLVFLIWIYDMTIYYQNKYFFVINLMKMMSMSKKRLLQNQ